MGIKINRQERIKKVVAMVERLEIAIWNFCGENECLALKLSRMVYSFFWWSLSGSFKCWALGHKFKKVNDHFFCVHCDEPMELINNPSGMELRLFERILVFVYSRTFEN